MPRDANEEWNHPNTRSRVRRRVIARSTGVGLEAAFGQRSRVHVVTPKGGPLSVMFDLSATM